MISSEPSEIDDAPKLNKKNHPAINATRAEARSALASEGCFMSGRLSALR
jgi:hypothetical protein